MTVDGCKEYLLEEVKALREVCAVVPGMVEAEGDSLHWHVSCILEVCIGGEKVLLWFAD